MKGKKEKRKRVNEFVSLSTKGSIMKIIYLIHNIAWCQRGGKRKGGGGRKRGTVIPSSFLEVPSFPFSSSFLAGAGGKKRE